jgi:hypothetical protein
MSSEIWRIEVLGAMYLGLIPHDLTYFNEHFCGLPMRDDWDPPPIEISGKSKKLPDFVIWMTSAPVVSEKAMLALKQVASDCLQFLEFHPIKGRPYFAMNVIKVEAGLLDMAKSDIFYADGDTKEVPTIIRRAFFREREGKSVPPIFKVSIKGSVMSEIFVSRAFGEVAVENSLTGVALADPSVPSLVQALSGQDPNVFPGLKAR